MQERVSQPPHRPRRRVSLTVGNLIQLAGLGVGAGLLWVAAQAGPNPIRVIAMLVGYLLVYLASHAVCHYFVGRLVGLQFRYYSIGGSFHANTYPGPLRLLFERMPFFAAHTQPASMRTAAPNARALMFVAGIGGTVLFSTAAAFYAYQAETPGSFALLLFNIIWLIGSLLGEMRATGDLGKAYKAIKSSTPLT